MLRPVVIDSEAGEQRAQLLYFAELRSMRSVETNSFGVASRKLLGAAAVRQISANGS